MACHGVISAGVYQRRIRLLTKLVITAPSFPITPAMAPGILSIRLEGGL